MNAEEIKVREWHSGDEGSYDALLRVSPTSMLTHSLKYFAFLQRVLGNEASAHHLVATSDDRMVGVLPSFVRTGPLGPVVNSLPFYGSHGGVVSCAHDAGPIRTVLGRAFDHHADAIGAFSSTVVESPIKGCEDFSHAYSFDMHDDRIGQISSLPKASTRVEAEAQVLAMSHPKTRNLVRKGLKGGFEVVREPSEARFNSLWNLHTENMTAVGGRAKQWRVFEAVQEVFSPQQDYDLYSALVGDEVAAALLVLYFKDTVEYFTPAVAVLHRSEQPLNLLILRAMTDAIVERSAKRWNWGGTWRSQAGVYHFKSRWGAVDHPYQYSVRLPRGNSPLRGMRQGDLLDAYPGFYVVPFAVLSP